MNIQISSSNVDLSSHQTDYIISKINLLNKLSQKISNEAVLVKVVVDKSNDKNLKKQSLIRVTISAPNAVFRAEVAAFTFEEAVDSVQEKLERQIKRYKAKHVDHRKVSVSEVFHDYDSKDEIDAESSKIDERITKRKLFSDLIPMSESDALDLMINLGHSFFIFVNSSTDRYNVLYRRVDQKGFGLVELETQDGILN